MYLSINLYTVFVFVYKWVYVVSLSLIGCIGAGVNWDRHCGVNWDTSCAVVLCSVLQYYFIYVVYDSIMLCIAVLCGVLKYY